MKQLISNCNFYAFVPLRRQLLESLDFNICSCSILLSVCLFTVCPIVYLYGNNLFSQWCEHSNSNRSLERVLVDECTLSQSRGTCG